MGRMVCGGWTMNTSALSTMFKDLVEHVDFLTEKISDMSERLDAQQDEIAWLRLKIGATESLVQASAKIEAEYQDFRKEQQRKGIERAKEAGVYTGRKRALTDDQIAELIKAVAEGQPKTEISRKFGISRETVYQYIRTNQETF